MSKNNTNNPLFIHLDENHPIMLEGDHVFIQNTSCFEQVLEVSDVTPKNVIVVVDPFKTICTKNLELIQIFDNFSRPSIWIIQNFIKEQSETLAKMDVDFNSLITDDLSSLPDCLKILRTGLSSNGIIILVR